MPSNTAAAPVDARLLTLLRALADEKRLGIVGALREGERCVCELQDVLGEGSQSLLSHHLRTLREAGVVRDRREGRWVHYSLVPGALEAVEDALGEIRSHLAAEETHRSSGCR